MRKELIIIGATGSLGSGVIDSFPLPEYDRVFLTGRNLEKIKKREGAYEIIKAGDLSDETEVKRIFEEFDPGKGKTFFLFSTLGGYTGGKLIQETEASELRAMIEINLYPAFLLIKHFFRLATESDGGSICLTSALASVRPEAGKGAYGASKSAMNYLVKAAALEGKEAGISVNAIAPFMIETEENRSWVKDVQMMVSPEEIGSIVNNLFKNYRTMTGNIIEIPFTAGRAELGQGSPNRRDQFSDYDGYID